MKHFALIAVATAALTFAGGNVAFADDCSGHDHDTGTVLGAAGGAAIGGLASHSVIGAVAGAVVGGVAGNAIARSEDCAKAERRADDEDRARAHAYDEGYQDRAAEDRQAFNDPRPLHDGANVVPDDADRDYPQ